MNQVDPEGFFAHPNNRFSESGRGGFFESGKNKVPKKDTKKDPGDVWKKGVVIKRLKMIWLDAKNKSKVMTGFNT